MGIWGAFMPAGIGMSMLITPPLLELHGWRGLWNDIGFIILFWSAILLLAFRGACSKPSAHISSSDFIANVLRLGPLLVVAGFVLLLQPVSILNRFSADYPGDRLQCSARAGRPLRRPCRGRQRNWQRVGWLVNRPGCCAVESC